MLREDREELYFNLCLENGFYMEAEDGKNIFQRLIDRIKALIEKIKKFINEKILKKEIPKEVEVDEGIMAHIKKGLGVIKKFLSNGFKFFATHKKITAAVLAVVGIGALVDLRNGMVVRIERSTINSTIRSYEDILKRDYNKLNEMEKEYQRSMKDKKAIGYTASELNHETEEHEKDVRSYEKMIQRREDDIKKGKERLEKLPKYGSILYAIAGYIQKVLTYLGSKIGKSKTEKKGE